MSRHTLSHFKAKVGCSQHIVKLTDRSEASTPNVVLYHMQWLPRQQMLHQQHLEGPYLHAVLNLSCFAKEGGNSCLQRQAARVALQKRHTLHSQT